MDFYIITFFNLLLNAVIIYDLHSEVIARLFIWARGDSERKQVSPISRYAP